MRTRHQRNEGGAALVMVLIFTSVFGLIVAALLTEGSVSFGFTGTVDGHEKDVYTADAGVSFGVQQVHQHNELCPTTGVPGPAIPNLTVKDRSVSVTCADTNGSTFGADGWAIVTTSTAGDSLDLEGAASEQKKVGGSVWVSGGVGWGTRLKVTGGNFYQQNSSGAPCLNPPPSIGPGLKLELDVAPLPPYGYYCVDIKTPDPAHNPPVKPNEILDLRSPLGDGNATCRRFSPGFYPVKPVLVADNYFVSGVYYFKFASTLEVVSQTVYGGQPGDGQTRRLTSPPPCALSDPAGTVGTGVEWIFGGGSSLLVNNPDGQMELFRRVGEPTPASDKLSMVAVPDDSVTPGPTPGPWSVGGWTANSVTATKFLDIGQGATTDMAIHGLVYAPNQWIALTATNSVLAQTMGGLVTKKLTMKSSASATGFAVSVERGSPRSRRVLITACSPAIPLAFAVPGACPSTPGNARPVLSRAVVNVANDAARTTNVESWRTRGAGD